MLEAVGASLSKAEVRSLEIQRMLGRVMLLPMGALMLLLIRRVFRVKLRDHVAIRSEFRKIANSGGPLLVCANHLTLVDSIIILWGLASIPRYALQYRLFGWNIPAIENYCKRPSWRLLTYFNKCIPIDRKGTKEHIDSVFSKLAYLMHRGDVCLVFPEGTRSRSGRVNVENAGYGIGKLIQKFPGCRVLCIYQRGDSQQTYSDFPRKGERFSMRMEVITPHSEHKGLRAVREYSMQVVSKLKQLEDEYFSTYAQALNR